jgi:RimJ/RimL family protein N-acetyltransferase
MGQTSHGNADHPYFQQMIMFPERIATHRLVLRRPSESDANDIFIAYARDPLVTRFLLWRPHESEDTVREFIASCIAGWEAGGPLTYAITEAPAGPVIGMIDARPKESTVDLGYVLARSRWGRGYMPEAIAALAAEALALGFARVQAFCDVENIPSQRALEKAGFSREARIERHLVLPNFPPEPRDSFLYAKLP